MDDSNPSKPKLRWYQFSLRSLLLFVLVAGMGFGWLGSMVQPIRNEVNAVAEIQGMGGTVTRGLVKISDSSFETRLKRKTGFDQWLRRRLGAGHAANRVELKDTGVTDADLATLKHLPDLEYLTLANTQITDAGLAHLAGLNNLLVLTLSNTQVTDAGLVHLKALDKLEQLDLDGTKVTYQALDDLRTDLPRVSISLSRWTRSKLKGGINGTIQVDTGSPYSPVISLSSLSRGTADADLVYVELLTTLETLTLQHTQITDSGLRHLEGLTNLNVLPPNP